MSGLVSVVIPCRNEVKNIRETVLALIDCDYPAIEILVVDGMSTDGTRDVLHDLALLDDRVRIIDNPHRLTPFAFNLGVKNATGEYVQIVGSRNLLDRSYISILVAKLAQNPAIACVGGDYQHTFDNAGGRFLSLAMESKFGVGMGNYRTMQEDGEVDTVGIPLYRRAIFREVGYFDPALTRNQDDDFNFRVRQRGYKIFYVHAAKATYLVRSSLSKAFRQFFQYGYFKVFVNRKHRAVTTLRQLVPAAFVAFYVVGLPLSLFVPWLRELLSVTSFVYFALGLTLAGRGLLMGERMQVLICCFVLHVGYGCGYWQGILDFLLLQREPRDEFQRQTT